MDQIGEGIRKLIMAGIGAVAMTKERSEDVLTELARASAKYVCCARWA